MATFKLKQAKKKKTKQKSPAIKEQVLEEVTLYRSSLQIYFDIRASL